MNARAGWVGVSVSVGVEWTGEWMNDCREDGGSVTAWAVWWLAEWVSR